MSCFSKNHTPVSDIRKHRRLHSGNKMPSIEILIIADTHNEWPYSPETPAPKVDAFIHCGDLTQYGGLSDFQRAIDNIKVVDAELKLIIAGNHDVDIDPAWPDEFAEDEDDVEVGANCLSLLRSQKEHGIHYLDEGTHTFTLQDGRSFTVYASPYTPKFRTFASLYGKDDDRFNEGAHKMQEDVDIVISHGPPAFPPFEGYKLDVSERDEHCGCEKLAKALERVKPRLACFGHIHKGRGAATMDWKAGKLWSEVDAADQSVVPLSVKGDQTVLVNAAVFGEGRGWLVDFEA
jgi:Icc-related predicted phosphoesterase